MKSIDRICLVLITLAMIYTAWLVSSAMHRLVAEHEANSKAYMLLAVKVMDERNAAEAHVAYLQKEIAKYHRSGWKK